MGFASMLAEAHRHSEATRTVTQLATQEAPRVSLRELRLSFAPNAESDAGDASSGDLRMVEQLLDRCWRELDAAELNVKLTDFIRLLELKGKLTPAADAERIFWDMIEEMRREELSDFGRHRLDSKPDAHDENDDD